MAMRLPLPQVPYEAGGITPVRAPGVEPLQEQRNRQLQGLGGAVTDVGLAIAKIQDFQQDRIDTATAVEAANALDDAVREDELRQLRLTGKAAVDAHKDTVERVRKRRRDAMASLKNPVQRLIFENRTEGLERQTIGRLDSHFLREGRNWEIGVTDAAKKNRIADAAREVAGRAHQVAREAAVQETIKLSLLNGFRPDDEATKAAVAETLSEIHSTIVAELVEQDPQRAEQYLKDHKQEIAPQLLDRLQANVRIGLDQKHAGEKAAAEDAAAWKLTNQIADTGLPLNQQRQLLRQAVEKEPGLVAVAERTWRQLEDLDLRRRQKDEDDEKALLKRVEQMFASDPNLSYDAAKTDPVLGSGVKLLESMGLGAKVRDMEIDWRAKRILDRERTRKDNDPTVDLMRDIQNLDVLQRVILFAEDPELIKTLPDVQKAKIQAMHDHLVEVQKYLQTVPRTEVQGPPAPLAPDTPEAKQQRARDALLKSLKLLGR